MKEQEKGSSLTPKYKSSIFLISLASTLYPSISVGLHPLKWKLNSQKLGAANSQSLTCFVLLNFFP